MFVGSFGGFDLGVGGCPGVFGGNTPRNNNYCDASHYSTRPGEVLVLETVPVLCFVGVHLRSPSQVTDVIQNTDGLLPVIIVH
jgi:hypothetical protein